MSEDRTVKIPPKGKIEWNLNTILQLAQIISLVVVGTSVWVNLTRDISELQAWRKETTKDIDNLKDVVRAVSNKNEALAYRVTNTEQQVTSISQTLKEIQTAVGQQAGDMRVVREILQRLEATQRQRD